MSKAHKPTTSDRLAAIKAEAQRAGRQESAKLEAKAKADGFAVPPQSKRKAAEREAERLAKVEAARPPKPTAAERKAAQAQQREADKAERKAAKAAERKAKAETLKAKREQAKADRKAAQAAQREADKAKKAEAKAQRDKERIERAARPVHRFQIPAHRLNVYLGQPTEVEQKYNDAAVEELKPALPEFAKASKATPKTVREKLVAGDPVLWFAFSEFAYQPATTA